MEIFIPVPKSPWHPFIEEYIWVSDVGDGGYRIENIPYYAKSLSYHDVIQVRKDQNGRMIIKDVVSRGGHSTYRCYLRKDITEEHFRDHFGKLEKNGCTFERATSAIFTINIPPRADFWKVYEELQNGEMSEIWDFEEGYRVDLPNQ